MEKEELPFSLKVVRYPDLFNHSGSMSHKYYWSTRQNGNLPVRVKEIFRRGQAVAATDRALPSDTYNAMRLLLDYSDNSCVFVPIRSMQYMAVIDHEEVIFVDAISARRLVEFSWQEFRPQDRNSLSEPVLYRFVCYDEKAEETMKRAQVEFSKSIHDQLRNTRKNATAIKVAPIPIRKE